MTISGQSSNKDGIARSIILKIIEITSAAVLSIWILVVLVINARRFFSADLINFGTGGFGHTIEGPDSLRRLYPGKKIFMVFAWGRGRYNSYVKDIFTNIDILIIDLPNYTTIFNRTVPFAFKRAIDAVIHGFLPALLRRVAPHKLIDAFYADLLPQDWHAENNNSCLKDPACLSHVFPGTIPSHNLTLAYFRIRRTVAAPPARLPDARLKPLEAAFAAVNDAGRFPKRCCFYNRKRGVTGDIHSYIRSGSDVHDLLPTVALLNARGYVVMLVGDEELPVGLSARTNGGFIDHKDLGIRRDAYQIWAATEADIFIACPAGGAYVGLVADRPTLLINNYPYYYSFENSVAFYKFVRNSDGTLLPLKDLFGEHYLDFVFKDKVVEFNSADDILRATEDFVTRVEAKQPLGLPSSCLPRTYDDRWIDHVDGMISPIWMEAYQEKRTFDEA